MVGFLGAENHKLIEIPTDADGIIPAELEEILSSWPPGRPRPKVLYTSPTGSNPTGATCPESRKIEMYVFFLFFFFTIKGPLPCVIADTVLCVGWGGNPLIHVE